MKNYADPCFALNQNEAIDSVWGGVSADLKAWKDLKGDPGQFEGERVFFLF